MDFEKKGIKEYLWFDDKMFIWVEGEFEVWVKCKEEVRRLIYGFGFYYYVVDIVVFEEGDFFDFSMLGLGSFVDLMGCKEYRLEFLILEVILRVNKVLDEIMVRIREKEKKVVEE